MTTFAVTGGGRLHRLTCRYLRPGNHAVMDLDDYQFAAWAEWFAPCRVCRPDKEEAS